MLTDGGQTDNLMWLGNIQRRLLLLLLNLLLHDDLLEVLLVVVLVPPAAPVSFTAGVPRVEGGALEV